MVSLKCKEIVCYIYSVLLFLSGLTLVIVSCLMWYQVFYHSVFLPGDTTLPFVILVFVGLMQLFLTWLTVKGPSAEHDFFIISSVIVIVVILVIEISTGIYCIVLLTRLRERTSEIMQMSFTKHVENFDKQPKNEWNTIESKLECCGVQGAQDYGDQQHLPVSCCLNDIVTNKCRSIHKMGCKAPLVATIYSLLTYIGIVAFSGSLIHISGVVAFIAYYKALKLERLQRSTNRTRLRQSLRNHQSPANGPNLLQPLTPGIAHSPSAPLYS